MNHPPIRSYVLRQGRFSRGQQRAYSELLPRFGIPDQPRPLDFDQAFGRHAPGVGSLLKQLDEANLENVRIVPHDAVEVLRDMVPPGSLAAIHVFFPDPWPKKRHHKRRLLQPPFAALAASRLAPGGVLHVATDWQEYAEHVLAVLAATPGLANTTDGFAPRPPMRPETKFERRGLKLGHGVWDLVFRRTDEKT